MNLMNTHYTHYTNTNHSDLLLNIQLFRVYWILLNTSYVMEFFLQTLVKRRVIAQWYMIVLQNILMIAASISAVYVLQFTDIRIAFVSLICNFSNRGHDVGNTTIIMCVLYIIYSN